MKFYLQLKPKKILNSIFLFFCVLKTPMSISRKGRSLLSSPAVNFSFASGVKKKEEKKKDEEREEGKKREKSSNCQQYGLREAQA